MALEALRERLETKPNAVVTLFSNIEKAFRKNVLLIQGIFGLVFTGMIITILVKISSGDYDLPWKMGAWTSFVGVIYGLLIRAEAWKESMVLANQIEDKASVHLENFYSKYNEWQFKVTEHLSVDQALEVFRKTIGLFNIITSGSIDEKLSKLVLFFNDVAFNTKNAVTGNIGHEVSSPAPSTTSSQAIKPKEVITETPVEETRV